MLKAGINRRIMRKYVILSRSRQIRAAFFFQPLQQVITYQLEGLFLLPRK